MKSGHLCHHEWTWSIMQSEKGSEREKQIPYDFLDKRIPEDKRETDSQIQRTGGCQRGRGGETDEIDRGDQRYKLPATR